MAKSKFKMVKEEIKLIKKFDKSFPKFLKEIHNSPKRLYVRGKLPENEDLNFAIVGTRACSTYGKTIAYNIAKELAQAGLTVVSGLALGIDSEAHRGAVDGGGKTIAVLGSGIDDDSIYPRENLKLAHKIIESGGAVISEYEPGFRAWQWSFPERNRIIAGLSRGVLVVEAPEKSGALITANFALEQNRDVFAVPGTAFSKNSAGTNNLIKSGAKLAVSAGDILEELNLDFLKRKQTETVKANLSKKEKIILKFLESEPRDIDTIIKTAKMFPADVLSTISLLEIKGIIKNIGGNKFSKTK